MYLLVFPMEFQSELFHGIHVELFHGIHAELSHGIHVDLFHGIHMDLSMESMVDMLEFHMEFSGIQVE